MNPGVLYIAVHIYDNVIVADSASIWQDDQTEIAIDGRHDGLWGQDDHQYTVTADGRKTDGGDKPGNHQVAVRRHIDGWDIEMSIPVSDAGLNFFTSGRILGLNLGLVDDDNGGDRDSYLVWEGVRTAPIEPTWGSLQLLGALVPITPTPTGQPTPTSTPPGDTLTLQDGLGTYAGTTDAYLYRLAPHTNYGASTTLTMYGDTQQDGSSLLVKFDLTTVPPGDASNAPS